MPNTKFTHIDVLHWSFKPYRTICALLNEMKWIEIQAPFTRNGNIVLKCLNQLTTILSLELLYLAKRKTNPICEKFKLTKFD